MLAVDTPIPSEIAEDDLYPADEDGQKKLVRFVQSRFQMADRARSAYEEQWLTEYKAYRSYRKKRKPGQWKSNIWIPISFYVIETITPRLAAALPSAKVDAIGPEDVGPAETLEELLEWSEDKSELYPEQVKAVKSALIYGTGLLKTGVLKKMGANIVREPMMTQTMQMVATGEVDIDGQPMMQEMASAQPMMDMMTGQPMMTARREEYIEYQGPNAQAVDIENFFPDPLGDDVQSCRWVIHRVYRDKAHIQDLINKGVYKLPEGTDPDEWHKQFPAATSWAALQRLSEIELSTNDPSSDEPKDLFAVLEMWRRIGDEVQVITVAGEQGEGVLLRAERSPYMHNMLPFVRIVDHIVPHEFWGVGELEPLSGIQDALNAMWNSRIDNVKLTLNQMFAVVMDYMENPSDLVVRPGGVVRMREGLPLNQVFQPIDLGDVTANAYTEAAELEREAEKVTGVSPYQTGQDSPAYNRTATGVALISEQGNTRFSFKTTLAEHTGYKHLVRQYASLLQQYVPDDLVIKIKGGTPDMVPVIDPMTGQPMIDPMTGMPAMQPDPMHGWKRITPESITGRFDFSIKAESSAQTLSMRREQTLSLAQTAMADPWFKPRAIREDLLEEFGRKDAERYLYTEAEIQMMQQAAAQQGAPAEEESGAPE